MRSFLVAMVLASIGCTPVGEIFFESDSIEFGPAVPGLVWKKSAYLRSRHAEMLTLSASVTNPAFEISFAEGPELPPMTTREVIVSYRPTSADRDEGSVTITTNISALSATMKVSGAPTEVDCTVPPTIDFGAVTEGESAHFQLPLKNASRFETTVVLAGPINPAFTIEGGSFQLGAGETRVVNVSFTASEARNFMGTMGVRRHQQLCDEQPILLLGTGVTARLSWSPATLDFGDVQVGSTLRMTVTFTNVEFVPVTLSAISIRDASMTSMFGALTSSLVIPAARRNEMGELVPGEASLSVEFTPTTTGPRAAILTANTDSPTQPTISVSLRGSGT